jgi:[acyl-carrier-protein] S-malonyltransferase
MAAVLSLDDEVVERLCAEAPGIVVPANLNSPGQVVVSGEAEAISLLLDAVKAAGGKARTLPVSGAFHSPLMQEAQDAMRTQLGRVSFHDAAVPVVQNVAAQPVTVAEQLKEHLAAQITGRVRWTESVRAMAAAGVTQVVELGPGKVLTGLVKRIAPDIACYNVDSAEAAAELPAWLEAQHG